MKKLKLFTTIATLTLGLGSAFAQSGSNLTNEQKAQVFANEVFLNCPQYATAPYIPDYTEVLNRIEIKTLSEYSSTNYELLSSVGLKTKCNTNLVADNASNFNPDMFNPFKYFLNLYPTSDIAYLVDNTQYVILIHAY